MPPIEEKKDTTNATRGGIQKGVSTPETGKVIFVHYFRYADAFLLDSGPRWWFNDERVDRHARGSVAI
jgi:hypothetical protein